ncbi:MAG: glycosyltransferase family 4 protein [Chromatiales bacterium]|nr:glycosyltransferase family 4 protein [Chromatiales bacterium]
MRVLWFAHVPVPEMLLASGSDVSLAGAHWTGQLLQHVAGAPGVELGVASAFPGLRDLQFDRDGIRYYTIGQPKRYPAFGMREADLDRCAAMVRDFRPDLLHFHGSERFFGLLKVRGMVKVPAVLSMQGLLGPYSTRRGFFGALSSLDILRSIRLVELPLRLGLAWQFHDIRRGARREARILGAVEGLLGRTDWDRAWGRRLNPQAAYHHVGEILRPAFYAGRWRPGNCERHTVVYTNAGHPRRGTENLLAAIALLRGEFPRIRLRLAGVVSERSGYGRFLRRRIRDLRLEGHVDFLGQLDDQAMVEQLGWGHVFAITSYLENSPNSLAEAMLIGMPCVASFVGGIPSMVDHGRSGLLFPVDDVVLLAEQVRQVFRSDELAVSLGEEARREAIDRHDPVRIRNQLLSAYQAMLGVTG